MCVMANYLYRMTVADADDNEDDEQYLSIELELRCIVSSKSSLAVIEGCNNLNLHNIKQP